YPEEEAQITKIKKSIVAGNYLTGKEREIVIGKKLAEKLGVGLGDKVVAMASSLDGTIGSEVFRIVGLYKTFSSEFDKTYIYIPITTSQKMLGLSGHISEFVFLVDNLEKLDRVKTMLQQKLGDRYEVLTYRDLLPALVMYMEMYKQTIWIFYLIVGIAMVFGIINTMLMAVFERIHEFGVLMAMGMKNGKLFLMIIIEAFYLGIFGTAIGLVLGIMLYLPLSHAGIDLSWFSEGLTAMGSGAVIYPRLTLQGFLNTLIIIPFISVVGAIYPAVKTIHLQPVTAIRYV
ncbi:MAG: ABC transporter permease, partial [Calditrichia bacterium]